MTVRRKLVLGLAPLVLLISAQAFLAVRTYRVVQIEIDQIQGRITPGAVAVAEMNRRSLEAAHLFADW